MTRTLLLTADTRPDPAYLRGVVGQLTDAGGEVRVLAAAPLPDDLGAEARVAVGLRPLAAPKHKSPLTTVFKILREGADARRFARAVARDPQLRAWCDECDLWVAIHQVAILAAWRASRRNPARQYVYGASAGVTALKSRG